MRSIYINTLPPIQFVNPNNGRISVTYKSEFDEELERLFAANLIERFVLDDNSVDYVFDYTRIHNIIYRIENISLRRSIAEAYSNIIQQAIR